MRLIRLACVLTLGLALGAPLAAIAQQKDKVWRVGFLGASSASRTTTLIDALRAGLREQGYVEGLNMVIEFRWADGEYERLPRLASELVELKVDLIVAQATAGARAAKEATSTVPIIMPSITDPVANGLVTNLARPGENITGMTYFAPELAAKQLELLKEVAPRIKRAGALSNPGNPAIETQYAAMEGAAKVLGLALERFDVRRPGEFPDAISAMTRGRVDAIVIMDDPLFYTNVKNIADLVANQRLPSVGFKEFAEAGGLMAYGIDRPEMWRRVGIFVDKIFKGARPGDLPVERATKFEMTVNLKTAKTLGFHIPQPILIRADKVIQ
jgi:putative ABC transport system substrate-binding protein